MPGAAPQSSAPTSTTETASNAATQSAKSAEQHAGGQSQEAARGAQFAAFVRNHKLLEPNQPLDQRHIFPLGSGPGSPGVA
jgi:hypothetical protein